MVIDIDIKIADNEGKQVHHFIKRFDEKLKDSEQFYAESRINMDFEKFLAGYLSASGRTIREKLIYPDTPISGRNHRERTAGESLSAVEGTADGYAVSELEYKIRIGNNKVIAGKIPFHKLDRLNKATDALYTPDDNSYNASVNNKLSDWPEYPDLYGNKGSDSGSKVIPAELEKNLKNLMIQAVEKYESSFYHLSEEQDIK